MRVRDTWLVEDVRSFDEPSDWSVSPEVRSGETPRRAEEKTFRALLDDPEACWLWESGGDLT
jgi:hypothetical protein